MDEESFDAVFFLTVIGAIVGLIGVCMKTLFKSKCSNVRLCCGLINVQRDVNAEERINEFNIENGVMDDTRSCQNNNAIRPANVGRIGSH